MKKKAAPLIVFLSLSLFALSAHCQEIADKEWEMYNKYAEGFARLMDESFQERMGIGKEVEEKYGVSASEYSDILMKQESFQDFLPSEVTAKEREILDYYDERVSAIDAERDEKVNEMVKQIADEEGISVDELDNILIRCSEQDPAYSDEDY